MNCAPLNILKMHIILKAQNMHSKEGTFMSLYLKDPFMNACQGNYLDIYIYSFVFVLFFKVRHYFCHVFS